MLRIRPEEKRDVSVVITGYFSEGKTTLSAALSLLTDDYFDYEKQVFWSESSKQVIDVIANIEPSESDCRQKKRSIWYDEGENQFSNVNPVMGLENRRLRLEYSVNREDGNFHFICLDDLQGLNKYMRDRRVLYWFHIFERGKCVLVRKDTTHPVKSNSWHLKHFDEILYQITSGKSPSRNQVLKAFSRMPNVWKGGIIRFPSMPEEFESKVSALKAVRKRKNQEENGVNRRSKSYQAEKYKSYLEALFILIRKNNVSLKSIVSMKKIPEGTAKQYYLNAGRSIEEERQKIKDNNTKLIINRDVGNKFKEK